MIKPATAGGPLEPRKLNMKTKFALILASNGQTHFINPVQVCDVYCTGGTTKQGLVVAIGLSSGETIHATGLGESEEDAIENCIAQLNEDAQA